MPLAEERGLAIDRAKSPWRGQYHDLGFSRGDQGAAYAAFAAFNEAVSNPQPGDVAASALPSKGRWNAFIDALSGYLNGTSLKQMSAEDYAAYSDSATMQNWRLASSYGSLIALLADGLQVEHGFAVRQMDWNGAHVRLSSDNESITAGTAIVSVPSDVLASGAIRFLPSVDDHLHAASQLPLGHVEKMFFALEGAEEFPYDAHLIGDPHSSDTGSYMLRPLGIPVVEGFFGGEWVAEASMEAIEALARRELGNLLGADFNTRIRRIAYSDWKGDPRFGGSYSYARPGQHGEREQLARPASERLAFAGEACSPRDYSTVHGAWESGIAAVAALFGESRPK